MKDLGISALISLGLVLPFAILEAVNTTITNVGDVAPLFAFLWFLPTVFLFVVMSIVRKARGGTSIARLLPQVAIVLVLVSVWGTLLVDQWPCFLGVPNCD